MSYVNQALIVAPAVKPKLGTASKVKYDNELAKEIKDDVFGWYADIKVDLKALLAEEVAAAGSRAMQLGDLASAEAAETSSAAAKRAVTGSKAVRRAAASDVLREAEAAAQSSDKVQRADAIVAGTLFSETTKALRDSGDVDACAPSMTQARVDFRVAFAANKSVDEAAGAFFSPLHELLNKEPSVAPKVEAALSAAFAKAKAKEGGAARVPLWEERWKQREAPSRKRPAAPSGKAKKKAKKGSDDDDDDDEEEESGGSFDGSYGADDDDDDDLDDGGDDLDDDDGGDDDEEEAAVSPAAMAPATPMERAAAGRAQRAERLRNRNSQTARTSSMPPASAAVASLPSPPAAPNFGAAAAEFDLDAAMVDAKLFPAVADVEAARATLAAQRPPSVEAAITALAVSKGVADESALGPAWLRNAFGSSVVDAAAKEEVTAQEEAKVAAKEAVTAEEKAAAEVEARLSAAKKVAAEVEARLSAANKAATNASAAAATAKEEAKEEAAKAAKAAKEGAKPKAAAPKAAAAPPPPPPPSSLKAELTALLQPCGLEAKVAAAAAWCDVQGAVSIAMILLAGEGAAFVESLGELKPVPKKMLLKKLGLE